MAVDSSQSFLPPNIQKNESDEVLVARFFNSGHLSKLRILLLSSLFVYILLRYTVSQHVADV
jgi:hypothetical protein